MNRHFGPRLRTLHWAMDQAITGALAEMELTAAQGRILGYIAHRPEAPCARDIEEAFCLTHPTVSGLLSRLEKKEFIRFQPDETDRRCKRLVLAPKGQECTSRMHHAIVAMEEQLVSGFSPEEREAFSETLERAIRNMGVTPCCKHQKEESKTHD